jgi:GT2 family glycosyltransferase
MEKLDVIILSNVVSDYHYNLTRNTVNSLLQTEGGVEVNVIIIESNSETNYSFPNTTIIKPNLPFNYGKFVNIGYTHCKNDWVIVCNNDLEFESNWFLEVLKVYNQNQSIKSFSFFEPDFHMRFYPDWFQGNQNLFFGYEVPGRLTGWCYLHRREILDIIGGCDEQFEFFYVDNDYGKML